MQQNILANILENEMPKIVGYSLPWKNEEENRSYFLIALNDIFSGAYSEFLKNPDQDAEKKPNIKSHAIFNIAKKIPKFFFQIQELEEGFRCRRIDIEVEKL